VILDDMRSMEIDMNPYEPPQTIDVSPDKPVKRFSVVMVIVIVALVVVGMFGLEVMHTYIAVGSDRAARQRAIEQQMQQQLKTN